MDGKRRRSGGGGDGGGGGERGGDQFEWHQIRGAPELLSLISNQEGRGSSTAVWSGQGKRVEQSEMKRNATFGMPLVFFKSLKVEIITGFPSASPPLHSSPPTMVLILKLLKL